MAQSIYIQPYGPLYKVCRGCTVLCTCENYFAAWTAREAAKKESK